jgi:adenosine/AMP kinase
MAFEVFKQVGASSKVYISISTSKTFGFPRTFLDKYGISSDHKVVILYDKSDNVIALHFTTDDVKYGLKVQIPNKKHGGAINAKSFFELKGIDAHKYAGRYEDFKQVPLSDIGISAAGTAFIIKLREGRNNNIGKTEGLQTIDEA